MVRVRSEERRRISRTRDRDVRRATRGSEMCDEEQQMIDRSRSVCRHIVEDCGRLWSVGS
jgi:hypothetical protein